MAWTSVSPSPPLRLCAFGDSFVHGVGDDAGLGWIGRLCLSARRDGLDVTCYNLGVRRDTSADIRARWRREAAARLPPDVGRRLLFSFGVNDCVIEEGRPRVPPEAAARNAAAILTDAAALGAPLMIGPPPIADAGVNDRVGALSVQFATLCRRLDIPYLDIFSPLAASSLWMAEVAAGDGAHPGAAGYGMLADLVGGWPGWRAWLSPYKSCA